MANFPALRLLLKLGRLWALFVAIAGGGGVAWLLWAALGWFALIPALVAFAFCYFLAKSYLELIQIISETVN